MEVFSDTSVLQRMEKLVHILISLCMSFQQMDERDYMSKTQKHMIMDEV